MNPITKGAIVDETRQTSMDGVFACGNVLHVHDLVDNVSMEAEIAGKFAAMYVNGGIEHIRNIKVVNGENVRYALPNSITTDMDEMDIYFRVPKTINNGVLTVDNQNGNIVTRKKKILTPGEMESVK